MINDIKNILAQPDFCDQSNFIILAGHYAINEEFSEISNLGLAETRSFELGVRLYRGMRSVGGQQKLVLWINDIGISPALRGKIKDSFVLPENYQEIVCSILGPAGGEEVRVLFESTMRNRASKKLVSLYKAKQEAFEIVDAGTDDLQRCVDYQHCGIAAEDKKAYSIQAPNGGRLVVKEGSNPKCNLILATLYDYLCRETNAENKIVSVFNVIYKNRILLGQHAYNLLFSKKAEFINYYVDFNGHITSTY